MCSAASPGPSISKDNIVLIIDLDETLLSINSFRIWALYFLLKKFARLNLRKRSLLWLKAAKIFAERKVLGKNHSQTKAALQKLWVEADDAGALENVLAKLEKKIRSNMRGVMSVIGNGEIDAVLATAAASQYADPFAQRIGFVHVLSTGLGEKENRGEEKARQISQFLQKHGWENRKKIFFTDHLEDMPFMLKSDKLMWFGKLEEVKDINSAVPELEIIICKNLDAQEIVKELS